MNVIRNQDQDEYEDEDEIIEVLKVKKQETVDDDIDKSTANIQVVETLATLDILPVTQDRPINVSSLISIADDTG